MKFGRKRRARMTEKRVKSEDDEGILGNIKSGGHMVHVPNGFITIKHDTTKRRRI